MEKYKTLSVLLLGIIVGMAYTIACGSIRAGNDRALATPDLPGIGAAMAHSGCSQFQLARYDDGVMSEMEAGYLVEPGWTPFGGGGDDRPWFYRCAK